MSRHCIQRYEGDTLHTYRFHLDGSHFTLYRYERRERMPDDPDLFELKFIYSSSGDIGDQHETIKQVPKLRLDEIVKELIPTGPFTLTWEQPPDTAFLVT